MIAAVIAKLVAHTPVSTTLMWTKSGVSQNSRGATRFANVTVNGRATTIDIAGSDREGCRDERGHVAVQRRGRIGVRDRAQGGEEHKRGHAEGIGGGGTAVAGEPDEAEAERDRRAGLPAEQRRSGRVGDPGGETAELAHLWLLRGRSTCNLSYLTCQSMNL